MSDITENLEKLVRLTNDGKIKWEETRSGVFIWRASETTTQKINVLIIRLAPNEILFRVWNVNEEKEVLGLKTSESNAQTKNLIEKLFSVAEHYVQKSKLDILGGLLEDL